jgi:hypothetical protein
MCMTFDDRFQLRCAHELLLGYAGESRQTHQTIKAGKRPDLKMVNEY